MDLGVEDRGALPFWGREVGVGVLEACDEPVETQAGQVVAHLVGRVAGAEQAAHPGAQAPVGEPEGAEPGAQGAEQGHDPRVAKTQGWSPPAVRGDGWQRDPLKGWARKDTTLPDSLSIEQAGIDVTGFGLQFAEVAQPALAAQVARCVNDGLDPQGTAVLEVLLDA